MGNNRKNKAPSNHQRKNSLSSPSSHHSHHLAYDVQAEEAHDDFAEEGDFFENTARNLDFSQVLQDVEGSLAGSVIAITGLVSNPSSAASTFRVSWKEMAYLLMVIVILAGLSIFMGVFAGITISIHYFDAQGPPSMDFRERRVTNLDPSIVSTNIIHPSGHAPGERELQSNLGRVVTMSESGSLEMLLVVEETSPSQSGTSDNDDAQEVSEALFGGQYKPYRHKGPPGTRLSSSKVYPTICSDGATIGFNSFAVLKAAIDEANALSAEKFMKWNEYFASLPDGTNSSNWFTVLNMQNPDYENDDDALLYYYDEDILFTICPGTTLKSTGPIFINAPNLMIECGDPEEYEYQRAAQAATGSSMAGMPTCTLDGTATHLNFGPHARNVLVRSIVFRSARTSSLTFHYNGAQATFEDCVWTDNSGVQGKYGAVADINTTSHVNFFQCEIGINMATSSSSGDNGVSQETNKAAYGGLAPEFASYLSLRT